MSRPVKFGLWMFAAALGIAAALTVAFLVVVQTAWFRNKVRERIVSVAEEATGGRVEIGKFDYSWHSLSAEVSPFVLHGKEPAGSPPFFRAAKIQVGLRIISALKKQVDIASLKIEQPQLYVTVAPDGSTNVPAPKVARSLKGLSETLLDLKVKHFELRDGFAGYNSRRIPLNIQGDQLQASLLYDSHGPSYRGEISSRKLQVSAPQLKSPVTFDLASRVVFTSNAIEIADTSLSGRPGKIELNGSITDFAAPRAVLKLRGSGALNELKKLFPIPLEGSGELAFQGQGSIETSPFDYKLQGNLTARGLGYKYKDVALRNISAASRLELSPAKLRLPNLSVSVLQGQFHGSAELADFRNFSASGAAQGFALKDLIELGGRHAAELDGVVSGPVRIQAEIVRGGLRNTVLQAQLGIAPSAGASHVQGSLAFDYNQAAGEVQLRDSRISLGASQGSFSGTFGETMAVHVVSRNLNDALALFALFGQEPPKELPVSLDASAATFDGTVSGPLAEPQISGKVDLGRFAFQGRQFDHLAATVDLGRSYVNFRTITLSQGRLRVEGQGRVSLRNWQVENSSNISGLLSVTGADVETLGKEAGIQLDATGTASGVLRVSGSLDAPLAAGTIDATNLSAFGEHADAFHGNVTASETGIEVSDGNLRLGPARIAFSGSYNHLAKDWKDGSLRLDVSTNRLALAQIKHVQDVRPGLGGNLELKASGTAKVVNGTIDLTSLTGDLALRNAVLDGQPYGNLEMTASTRLPILGVSAKLNLNGVQIEGSGEWRMEGDYSGQARFRIPRIPVATLHELVPGPHARPTLPFEGFIEGEATVAGPLNNPKAMKADIELTAVQLNASANASPIGGFQPQDLVLRNAGPVSLEATKNGVDIRSASFTGRDTSLNATGRMTFDSKNPWDVNVAGRVNLSILQIFNPNLLASGASLVSLSVRGPLMEAQIDGRLELRNASLFLRDFPNGVDQANGTILFDRNRATVQTLAAVTGGGTVTFDPGSFVGFRGPALLYRLQASAQNVRYRTPEGISVTVDASLALVGTSDNSVLSGSMRVTRAVLSPRTDVGALLASTQRPISAPSEPNQYLKGLQFDVQVQSAGSLEVETSLTRNIQLDASLRLRGTPNRPILLGTISISSGQVEFFGNKYTVNRGDIRFLNPARIEPTIDMNLETQVRGITVDVSFSGSLNKLNFSYHSDPPLQANDIIALLAVGRTPSTAGPLAGSQTTSSSYLSTGGNALLGQAIAPATGRLQKFFGVTHLKIDPQITDVTSIPEARLTFEQQVSSDITITYITNTAVANQQIIRVQWDLNKRWSVVSLRDENGAFSIDFLYKKSYK
ncbi:MAG TPA: translocation/assembly module TamB domain-containing protein [Bryobacteraceae bacterium]|nr:translocation/assembly module TamB domain-containing protein [Bryobacteraceae bacterium]